MRPVMVIAEAALTWRYPEELRNASESITLAAWAGADAWKTQWTSDPVAMAARRRVTVDYSRLAWPVEWHDKLADMCYSRGIRYMCTAFLPGDVGVISRFTDVGKVAYSERIDQGLIMQWVGSVPLKVIVSGGLNPGSRVDVLHCVSKYPTPAAELRVDLVQGKAGLSDHSLSLLSGAVAVGAGAKIIEKHFRLDHTPSTDADYPHSLTAMQLKQYIANIREAAEMVE